MNQNQTSRYVVAFDTHDLSIRDTYVPSLLSDEGLTVARYFPRLGIAVLEGEEKQFDSLCSTCHDRDIPVTVVPETTYHAIEETQFDDTAQYTWGLQATEVVGSPFTGAGVKLAVLDTGFHTTHPDFAERTVVAESFIDTENAEDNHGHGTHCIGTAAGPRSRTGGQGYGVAPGVEIYSGKVLGADGRGTDTTILAGIDWALQQGCQVISMSLGADVRTVHPPYVVAGRRALELGSIIIAAAGNNANRSAGNPGFVGAPANSPYVMAVGAIDRNLEVADFSARAVSGEGGEVDIAAPGVDIFSSWVAPANYRTISGTSMATPHVSGVAALIAESTGARGQDLWDRIVAAAQPLNHPHEDVGAGLCVVPGKGKETPVSTNKEQRWVITVENAAADCLEAVATQLRAKGVTVTKELSTLGVMYGTSQGVDPADLLHIPGVTSADLNHEHRINPPDAEVQ